jgi:hypothetical protein
MELTNTAREITKNLNLDPNLEVLVSLKDLTERQVEDHYEGTRREEICGYYVPERRQIVIFYPCVVSRDGSPSDRLIKTLAHELIHHCQYTCPVNACRDVCEISLSNIMESLRLKEMLPYDLRPHEIEAYEKQEMVAEKIKNKWGAKIGTLIQNLDVVVRPPLGLIIEEFRESTTHLSEIFVANMIELLKRTDKHLLTENLLHLLDKYKNQGSLDSVKYKLSNLEDLFRFEIFSASPCKLLEEDVYVKSVYLTSTSLHNQPKLKAIINTNSGFALMVSLNHATSLVTLKLVPKDRLPLLKLLMLRNLQPSPSAPTRIYEESQFDGFKVQLWENSDEEKILQEVSEELCQTERLFGMDLEELACLIALLNGDKDSAVERFTRDGSGKDLVRVTVKSKEGYTKEALVCGGTAIIKSRELDKAEVLKALINPNAMNKEVADEILLYFDERLKYWALRRLVELGVIKLPFEK